MRYINPRLTLTLTLLLRTGSRLPYTTLGIISVPAQDYKMWFCRAVSPRAMPTTSRLPYT